jgi:hypothetical protein
MSVKYRTIVADPPWHYDRVPSSVPSGVDKNVVPGALKNEPYTAWALADEALQHGSGQQQRRIDDE